MHFLSKLSTIATLLLASSAIVKGDDSDTMSVNVTVNGSMQNKNGTFQLNTGVQGFSGADGRIEKPENKTDGMFKNVKDMWRALKFNVKSNRVEVRSKLANHSDYRFIVSTEGGHPRIRAFLHNDDDDSDQLFLSTYMVHFLRVVEVNDTIPAQNSTSYISLNKPRNGANSNFDKAWSPFSVSTLSVNGTTVFTANTSFTDPAMSGFNFTLSTFLSQASANMTDASGTFKPNALKYSISMTGFPFKYQNSHLVLVQNIWTKDMHVNTSSNSTLALGNPTNQLSWNATISVRHNETDTFVAANITANTTIVPTSVDDTTQPDMNDGDNAETPKMVVYHFLAQNLTNSSQLVWDPEVAVAVDASAYQSASSTSTSSGSSRGFGRMESMSGALIGLVLCYVLLL